MSPRKTKSRKVLKSPNSGMPPSQLAPSGQSKWIVRGLIAVVVAVCVVEGLNLTKSETPKSYKVQSLLMIKGSIQKCGSFSAWGVAPVGKDKIMVADHGNNRILLFDREGKCIKIWGKAGSGAMEFHEPSGMTSDDKGNAYVIDSWNGSIKGFDQNGKEILNTTLPTSGSFYGPRGIAFDGHDFAIADTGSQRIGIVSVDGKVETFWGGGGKEPGKFKAPLDIATDEKGNYFVADSENDRLQWLNQDGKVVKVFKYKFGVQSVAVDKEGRFFVSTANNDGNGCIKAYSMKEGYLGDLVDEKGSTIPGDYGLAVGPGDVLMISGGDQIALYQLPAATP